MQLNFKKASAKLKEAMCKLTDIYARFFVRDAQIVPHISRVCISSGSVD